MQIASLNSTRLRMSGFAPSSPSSHSRQVAAPWDSLASSMCTASLCLGLFMSSWSSFYFTAFPTQLDWSTRQTLFDQPNISCPVLLARYPRSTTSTVCMHVLLLSRLFFLFWVRIVIALPHGNATFVMDLAVSLVRFLCWLLQLCDMLFVDFWEKSALLNVLYDWTKYVLKSIAFVSFAFAKRVGMIERFINCANKYFLSREQKLRCISWGYFFLMNNFSSCTLNLMYYCAKYVVCTSSSIRVVFCQIIPRCFSKDRSVSSCCCPYEVSKFAMCFFRLSPCTTNSRNELGSEEWYSRRSVFDQSIVLCLILRCCRIG